MKNKILILLGAVLLLGGCNIDRFPHGSMSAQKIKEDPNASLDALLNGAYIQLKGWSDVMHRCGEYAGDNVMIRGASTDAFYEFISYKRTPKNYRLQTFWDNSYKAIAQTSNIINLIPESDDPKINNKLGEAYYIRGLMYFYLCRAYGRPYYQSPDKNLGVPIVNGTPDDINNLHLADRATVAETYNQAINDLTKAETLMTIDRGPAYASKEAAQALLSRIYLYMSGTYTNPNREYAQKAVEYANKVIDSGKYKLLSRNDFMGYNTIVPENNSESIFVVKRVASEFSGYDHYYGIGGMYSNIGGMGWGEMYASAKYLDLLNETGRNDWVNGIFYDARAKFIEPQYLPNIKENDKDLDYKQKVFRFVHDAYDKSNNLSGYAYDQINVKMDASGKLVINSDNTITATEDKTKDSDAVKTYTLKPVNAEQGIYSIVYSDNKTYTGVIDDKMKLNRAYPMFYIVKCSREGEDSQLHSPIISRLGEIYLNRAEAYAKLGNYANALQDLNTIRNRSIINGGYASLDASNAPERIDKERQLELAFQAERSYDVYRNGDSLTRKYPGPHNALETILPDDYRVVYYIPQKAIDAYPGTLTQNPTK